MDNLAKLGPVADLFKKTQLFIHNVSVKRGNMVAFGTTQEGEGVFIPPQCWKKLKGYEPTENDLIEVYITPNKVQAAESRHRTPCKWKAMGTLTFISHLGDDIEDLSFEEPEPEPQPTPEELVRQLFEDNPEEHYSSREVSAEVKGTEGVNMNVASILRRMHREGQIAKCIIKSSAKSGRGIVNWGLNIHSFNTSELTHPTSAEVDEEELFDDDA